MSSSVRVIIPTSAPESLHRHNGVLPIVTPVESDSNVSTFAPVVQIATTADNTIDQEACCEGGIISAEKVGRWTEMEHLIFIEGLEKHGKQWKIIAGMIGTRTVVQVRTHAQKYFQKMERNLNTTTENTTGHVADPISSTNGTTISSSEHSSGESSRVRDPEDNNPSTTHMKRKNGSLTTATNSLGGSNSNKKKKGKKATSRLVPSSSARSVTASTKIVPSDPLESLTGTTTPIAEL